MTRLAKVIFTTIIQHTNTRNLEIPVTHKAKIKLVGLPLNLDTPLGYNILENTIHTRELAVETFRTMYLENFLRHSYYPG